MLSQFAREIDATIRKHAMLDVETRVLIGVSGGADSVALLLVLLELGYDAAVAHLNHGLRGVEADHDERFARDLAARFARPFFSRRVFLSEEPGNLEAAGITARRDFFEEILSASGYGRIARAHTRN